MNKFLSVVVVPGDGIGPEITRSVLKILEATGVPLKWIFADAGLDVLKRSGSALPTETCDLIREHRLAIKGPTTTPSGSGHQSINVLLRKKLGLFANIRPSRILPGIVSHYQKVNLIIVRENIEDTYSGVEYLYSTDVAMGVKLTTTLGSERVIRSAFELARREGRDTVCCVHKANIHKFTDGLFLETFRRIQEEYTDIKASEMLVDNACMQLVVRPEQFDIIVTQNLYGDILSDLCAGLVGGLGVAPSANLGNGVAVFEAVHGSAPDIAGKNLANPTALLLAANMLLKYCGLHSYATSIEQALCETLTNGQLTRDVGGELGTGEFTDFVISKLKPVSEPSAPALPLVIEDTISSFNVSQVPKWKGVDVYVAVSDTCSMPPLEFDGLELESVSCRGLKIEPLDFKTSAGNIVCLRYISTKQALTDTLVFSAVATLSEMGFSWVRFERLQQFENKLGYSLIS